MKRIPWGRMMLAGALLLAPIVFCQSATMAEANKFMQEKAYDKASVVLEKLTKNEPENAPAWNQLGAAFYSMKRYDKAVEAYRKADALQFSQPAVRYNIACSLALAGKQNEALDWLDKAIASGFSQAGLLESDPDLKSLLESPRFKTIREGADRNAFPCKYDERHRALDFWVGAWDVFSPQGQKIGTNVIEKKVGDCLIYENWTSAFGGGQSMNYFDPSSGKWKQNWVSKNGSVVWYEGEVIDGAMHFEGENIAPNGRITPARVTLSPNPDGTLRHLIETSQDGGKTWAVSFDGKYVRQLPN